MAQVTGIRRNLYDRCIHLDNLIDGSFMRSVWRKHLIICLFLGPMAVPMYLLDRAFLGGGGSNWITLDFRGLIFWTYITLVAIHVMSETELYRRETHSSCRRFSSSRGRYKICSVLFVLSPAAIPAGAPRKNHTWETRHLAGPIRDVGSAGHGESVSAGLRRHRLGEA